jgi:HlyD family secretion protein
LRAILAGATPARPGYGTRVLDSSAPHAAPPSDAVLATLGVGKQQRRRRLARWALALVLVGGLAGALAWWRASDRGPAIAWETVAATRGDIAVSIDATGKLEPEQSVTIGAEVSGKIAAVEVEEDARVEQGQLLARFDLDTFEGELSEAKASLASAKADVKRAKASRHEAELSLARTRTLVDSGVASAEELEQRETNLELAEAELGRAHAQQQLAAAHIAQIEIKLRKAEIHAPIAGVVLTRNVDPGSTVAASFQAPELFTIAADLGRMKLELAIDEADVGRIAPGQQASFVVDAWPEREFPASVRKVHLAPQVSGNVVTYVAELSVDNREGLLRPGMTATATIAVGVEREVLRVPVAALRFSPPSDASRRVGFGPPPTPQRHASGSAVWVLREDASGVAAPVKVAIEAGASDGEWLAVGGAELREGDLVLIGASTSEDEGR